MKSAPNSSSSPCPVIRKFRASIPVVASFVCSVPICQPPSAVISLMAARPAGTLTMAAAAIDRSYHWARRPSLATRPRQARARQTTASGAAAMKITRASPTSTQASTSPVTAGTHQRLPRPVDQDEQGQHRHRGAGVVGPLHERLGAVAELRGQHDRAAGHGAHHPGRAAGPAAREERREQHQQRVGHRAAEVREVGVQPARRLKQHVLRQLGRVEGHVRDPPAAQQRVAVQHVPGQQVDRGAVGSRRDGPRLEQVGGEQHDGHDHHAEPPRPARRGPGAGLPDGRRPPSPASPKCCSIQPTRPFWRCPRDVSRRSW